MNAQENRQNEQQSDIQKPQQQPTDMPKQAPVEEPGQKDNRAIPLVDNEKGSAGPYILAWLLGVPASLLIMIALLRAVF